MFFDHRSLWTQLQDKHMFREYAARRVGKDILPQLYWVTKNPSDIPFASLPERFVVKPTHGSGWVYLVTDKARVNMSDVIHKCHAWLGRNFYRRLREWVYRDIEPRILVEEFISSRTGMVPTDYKFYVFDGHVHVIQVDVGRFTDHGRNFYGCDWNKLDATSEIKNVAREVERPKHLEMMIEYAAALGRGLDFIRVDFYDTDERTYLGELTPTPGAGMNAHRPAAFAISASRGSFPHYSVAWARGDDAR